MLVQEKSMNTFGKMLSAQAWIENLTGQVRKMFHPEQMVLKEYINTVHKLHILKHTRLHINS